MDIRLKNIRKSYGDKVVLNDVTYEISYGDMVVLMGPSGVGKTTMLRILAGLEQADAGTITGIPRCIGMVFQEDRLCEECSVKENLNLVLKHKMPDELLLEHLGEVGLAGTLQGSMTLKSQDILHSPVSSLSGGMKRRVAVLRAMLAENELLLMDEPFSGLDGENRKRTLDYIKRHRAGRTLILVSHEEKDAEIFQGKKWNLL